MEGRTSSWRRRAGRRGRSSQESPSPTAARAPAPRTGAQRPLGRRSGRCGTQEAFYALLACATDAGLDGVVARAPWRASRRSTRSPRALTAVGACEDEARALLVAAIGSDVAQSGDLVRGIVGDTAACLDRKGVTISSIADALLGGARRLPLAPGRRGGVPARPLLADPLTRSGPDGGHDPPFERWRHPPIATSIRSGEGGRPEAPPVRETGRASRPGLEETTVAGPERIRPSVVLDGLIGPEPERGRAPRGSGLASRSRPRRVRLSDPRRVRLQAWAPGLASRPRRRPESTCVALDGMGSGAA